MADTLTPKGTINLWARSTDVRTLLECQMKYLLGRLYESDSEAGYFMLGTAVHDAAEQGLLAAMRGEEAPLPALRERARAVLAQHVVAAQDAGKPIRWTKRRPEEKVFDVLDEMVGQFHEDVLDPAMRMPIYQGAVPLVVELETWTESAAPLVVTSIDAIFMQGDGDGRPAIVDWKSGATAKAEPLQLWLYNYAARHTEGSPLFGMTADMIDMWFHHIAFSKVQRVANYPGDDYIEGLLVWVRDTKLNMMDTGFAPARPDWYCDYCQHQDKCPTWGGSLQEVRQAASLMEIEKEPERSNP